MKDCALVRKPTKKELAELREYFNRRFDLEGNEDSIDDVLKDAYYAVFPNYRCKDIDYEGKLLCLVRGKHPVYYEAFLWIKGKLDIVAVN
jgi:calcineurin-like phosphoesterase family protein